MSNRLLDFNAVDAMREGFMSGVRERIEQSVREAAEPAIQSIVDKAIEDTAVSLQSYFEVNNHEQVVRVFVGDKDMSLKSEESR